MSTIPKLLSVFISNLAQYLYFVNAKSMRRKEHDVHIAMPMSYCACQRINANAAFSMSWRLDWMQQHLHPRTIPTYTQRAPSSQPSHSQELADMPAGEGLVLLHCLPVESRSCIETVARSHNRRIQHVIYFTVTKKRVISDAKQTRQPEYIDRGLSLG